MDLRSDKESKETIHKLKIDKNAARDPMSWRLSPEKQNYNFSFDLKCKTDADGKTQRKEK